ncbi:MAG: deoxyribodipyrimidine photo-lyase [Pseudomonadota bacterium]
MHKFDKTLMWFRRDLRSFDNAALHHALLTSRQVACVFVYDREILDRLPRRDRRVEFIHESIGELAEELEQMGGSLILRYAIAADDIPALAELLDVQAVVANRDYEPQAAQRDAVVEAALEKKGRRFLLCKDQVIFERDEVLSLAGKPFTIFTPYKNAWLKKLQASPVPGDQDFYIRSYPIEAHRARFAPADPELAKFKPSLETMGFERTNLKDVGIPTGMSGGAELFTDFVQRMTNYRDARNFPGVKGPSYLSVHLRFGTVSIRALARQAVEAMRTGEGAAGTDNAGSSTWLSELIWRDFYFMILDRFPHVADQPFKPEYARIEFETGPQADILFTAWCEGRTGFPLVDAGMTQLNQTGYMHNRLRMVTACFLIKDLGIDWRRGNDYFAERLNDYDMSANNGGWQWAASSGCDAQPYFRIFNPITQSEKFDPEGNFIRRYLPQLAKLSAKEIHSPWLQSPAVLEKAGVRLGENYPLPVVEHDEARKRTLERYAVVKKAVIG